MNVRLETVTARPIAAVRARMPIARVPAEFKRYLDQVYAAGKQGLVQLDGQNVFVYRHVVDNDSVGDIEFGVGVKAPFATPAGAVQPATTPAGVAATATHWGDYSRLGETHSAIMSWCKANEHTFAGTSWEVYGHWSDDPTKVRTDVYHLIDDQR